MKLIWRIFLLCLVWIFELNCQVFVNQAGYLTSKAKGVFTSTQADSFYLINVQTNKIVFRGPFQEHKLNDPSTGLNITKGEFSNFTQEGEYFVQLKDGQKSPSFIVSESVYNSVFNKSLKSFYYQRCGTLISNKHVGAFHHAACHQFDAFLHSSTGSGNFNYAIGGWHDAGDYGKYIVNAGITVGTLLLAYELFPDKLSTDDLNIPESGNSIPDILDEIKYELDWMLKMQTDDGGVYHKITPENFSGIVLPQYDDKRRYVYSISTTATADFAAVMAKAGRVYKSFDEVFSNTCLNAAKKSWEYLEFHPMKLFSNPSSTNTGEYGDWDDSDERLWAAVELFLTTNQDLYHDYIKVAYSQNGKFNSVFGWQNVNSFALLNYLLGDSNILDSNIKNELSEDLQSYCNSLIQVIENDGFNKALLMNEYVWGSNSIPLNKTIILIVAYEKFEDSKYYFGALSQLNYILGINAHSISYVTGIGTKYPTNIHHRPSAADGIDEPIPGLLAGGPNKNITNDPILSSNFNQNTPPALCYIDHFDSYASNEIAINWNAPLVFVAGYFSDATISTSLNEKSMNNKAIDERALKNYPNPFNNSTQIEFILEKETEADFLVYDLTGRKVYEEFLGFRNQGIQHISWNGKNSFNESLSSGIYLYAIKSTEQLLYQKMIILK